MAVHSGIILLLIIAPIASARLQDQLHYYETLKISDFSHRVKRSVDPDPDSQGHIQELQVRTLGRSFHLYLKPSTVLAVGFKASVVRANGRSEPLRLNRAAILTGHLDDDPDAIANVEYEDNGSVLANIITKDDTYVIEPSWRHLPHSSNHSMVAYKRSNLKNQDPNRNLNIQSTCGIKEGSEYADPELHGQIDVDVDKEPRRHKRQTSPYLQERTTCHLMAVADYKFFENMGGRSTSATALYIIHIMQFVNDIYRRTQFDSQGNSMIGVGFEIGELRIHNESTPATTKLQGRTHYNVKTEHWDTKLLLEAFSGDLQFKKFCLAHLFTYRRFDDGVLGLAYIASDRRSAVGGICSSLYPKYPGSKLSLNTGWSSSQNSGGSRILALQAQLVTSHEFGHNMGSEHDPESDSCAPSDFDDGKYIMYPWAVQGYDKNNQVFSPCSREYIFKVIKVKGYGCFIEGRGSEAFCGNGRIDKGEECDAGWNSKSNTDLCCDDKCQLRPGKACSPMNYGCCSEFCKPAAPTTICRPAIEGSCLDSIFCDGKSYTCPSVTSIRDDGYGCIDQGVCKQGRCLNFCELFNITKEPCICSRASNNACHRCCRNKTGGLCESINNTLLPDGRSCYQGVCNQGVCTKQQRDMVQRLFNIIEDISVDQLVAFMRSNIVGTVMVLSLFIWIPVSCVVTVIDKKRAQKEKAKRNWMSRSNRTLFSEEESTRIRRVAQPRGPRHLASVVRREHGEPTVRWPESHTYDNPPRRSPQPVQPPRMSPSPPARDRTEGLDIGPDGDRETVV